MSLFGKKKITATETAGIFQRFLGNEVFENWPDICEAISNECDKLESGMPSLREFKNSDAAVFEFFLAVAAIQTCQLIQKSEDTLAAQLQELIIKSFQQMPLKVEEDAILPSDRYAIRFGFVANEESWDEDELEDEDEDEEEEEDNPRIERHQQGKQTPKVEKVYLSYINEFLSYVERSNSSETNTEMSSGPAYLYLVRLGLIREFNRTAGLPGSIRPFLAVVTHEMMVNFIGNLCDEWWKNFKKKYEIIG